MQTFEKILLAGYHEFEFVGGLTYSFAGSVSDVIIPLTLDSGKEVQPDDVVVVVNGSIQESGSGGSANLPTGFTNILNVSNTVDKYDTFGRISIKRLSSGETSITIPGGTGNTSYGGSVSLLVFRNLLTNQDVTPQSANGNNTLLANPPAITPVTTNAVIICGGVGADKYATGIGAHYNSSDLTNFLSSETPTGADTYKSVTGIGYKIWTSGSFDAAAFTFTGTDSGDYSWVAFSIALKP